MNLMNKMIISCIPFLPKSIVQIFSKKYVAGINNIQVLQVIKKINTDNQYATVDILGEHTSSIQNCKNIANQYIELLQEIDNKKLNCNLSIKPSHIGADISYEVVFENFKEILKIADSYNNFIRIDMESSKLTKTTIRLYKDLKLISNNIGIVFQAYLYRTQDDILNLPENSNVRLCKGIYKELDNIAYQDHDKINKNYIKILKSIFKKNIYVGIATHDKKLINESIAIIEKEKIKTDRFEFQYLYGVPMDKTLTVYKNKGFKVRTYVPYGKDWYDYSIRRIKENPKIASYVIKNILSKN